MTRNPEDHPWAITPKTQVQTTLFSMLLVLGVLLSASWWLADKINTLSTLVLNDSRQDQAINELIRDIAVMKATEPSDPPK